MSIEWQKFESTEQKSDNNLTDLLLKIENLDKNNDGVSDNIRETNLLLKLIKDKINILKISLADSIINNTLDLDNWNEINVIKLLEEKIKDIQKMVNKETKEQWEYRSFSSLKTKIAKMEARDKENDNDDYDIDSILEWNEKLNEITSEELESIINDSNKIKEIFTDISKLKDFIDIFNNSIGMWFKTEKYQYLKFEDVVKKMMDKLKWNDELLKKIVDINLNNDFDSLGDWYVAINALIIIENQNEDYYKNLLKNSWKNDLVTNECIRNINNQDFLKSIIENVKNNSMNFKKIDGSVAVENIEDQNYLEILVLDEENSPYIIIEAIKKLNNKMILEKFANISDKESNQYYMENGKRLYTASMFKTEEGEKNYNKVYYNWEYKKIAIKRLNELDK